MNQKNMNRIIEKLTPREQEEVEAFAAFLMARRSMKEKRLAEDDIPIHELMALVMQGGGFDWLNDEEEDIYSIQEGEAPKWEQE